MIPMLPNPTYASQSELACLSITSSAVQSLEFVPQAWEQAPSPRSSKHSEDAPKRGWRMGEGRGEGGGRQGTQEEGQGGKSEAEGYESVGRQEGRDSDGESS